MSPTACCVCHATESLPRPPAVNRATSDLRRELLAADWYTDGAQRFAVMDRAGEPTVCSASCGDRFLVTYPSAAAFLAATGAR